MIIDLATEAKRFSVTALDLDRSSEDSAKIDALPAPCRQEVQALLRSLVGTFDRQVVREVEVRLRFPSVESALERDMARYEIEADDVRKLSVVFSPSQIRHAAKETLDEGKTNPLRLLDFLYRDVSLEPRVSRLQEAITESCVDTVLDGPRVGLVDRILGGIGGLYGSKGLWKSKRYEVVPTTHIDNSLGVILAASLTDFVRVIEESTSAVVQQLPVAVASEAALERFADLILGEKLRERLGIIVGDRRYRALKQEDSLADDVHGQLMASLRREQELTKRLMAAEDRASELRQRIRALTDDNKTLRVRLEQESGAPESPWKRELPKYQPGAGRDPLEFLEEVYGSYLRYFGATKDLICQSDLNKLDAALSRAVANRLYYLRRTDRGELRLRDIVPTKSDQLARGILASTAGSAESQ